MVLLVNTAENTFFRVTQKQFNLDMFGLLKTVADEHHAYFTSGVGHHTLQGLNEALILISSQELYGHYVS
jgi:hypothetical protein